MNVSALVKTASRLHRRSVGNLFDALTLLQDHAQRTSGYWVHHMGLTRDLQAVVEQYWNILRQGGIDTKRLIDGGFESLEDSLALLDTDSADRPNHPPSPPA